MTSSRSFKRRLAAGVTAVLVGSLVSSAVQSSADAKARPAATARPAAKARPATPEVARPVLSGPVTGGSGSPALSLGSFPLSSVGYSESEYFFSGTATAYTNTAPLTSDGRWSVAPSSTAAYKSRMVVVRPTSPQKFSGTVIVEWLNVSAGQDTAADWALGHDEMIRSGDVYIGVSAQAVGVNALKLIDPARYGSLSHPGDSYSYNIFSQAGAAARFEYSTLLSGLRPRRFIADGESQSAFRLTTYVNAISPLAHIFDSFLIHSRAGGSSALSESPLPTIATPAVVYTRTDISQPVLTFQTETDPIILGYLPATQPDSRYFRLWEAAGTAHADAYVLQVSANDDGSLASDKALFGLMQNPPSTINIGGFTASCTAPFNTGEQHYVFQTALHDLVFWTRTGVAPRSVPRFATTPAGGYVLDSNGNVVGGVRSPAVDVPVATLSGLPPAGAPGFCVLFGSTTPFTAAQFADRYPSYREFAARWRRAVIKDEQSRFLLPADAARLLAVV